MRLELINLALRALTQDTDIGAVIREENDYSHRLIIFAADDESHHLVNRVFDNGYRWHNGSSYAAGAYTPGYEAVQIYLKAVSDCQIDEDGIVGPKENFPMWRMILDRWTDLDSEDRQLAHSMSKTWWFCPVGSLGETVDRRSSTHNSPIDATLSDLGCRFNTALGRTDRDECKEILDKLNEYLNSRTEPI